MVTVNLLTVNKLVHSVYVAWEKLFQELHFADFNCTVC